jgi:hypothetical protein
MKVWTRITSNARVEEKTKLFLEQTVKAQRGSKDIALLFP